VVKEKQREADHLSEIKTARRRGAKIHSLIAWFFRQRMTSYSYNKSQQDAQFQKFGKVLHMFGQVHCPSSGASQHCIHAIGICHASSVARLLADSQQK
jgi:hypothetical protein